MARSQQRTGRVTEAVIRSALIYWGLRCVEKVATPMVKCGKSWVFARKTGGDFRGVLASGRSVMVEAKARKGRLCWSDFEPHQHRALQEHAASRGLSLVAWYDLDTGSIYIFEYPRSPLWESEAAPLHDEVPFIAGHGVVAAGVAVATEAVKRAMREAP